MRIKKYFVKKTHTRKYFYFQSKSWHQKFFFQEQCWKIMEPQPLALVKNIL